MKAPLHSHVTSFPRVVTPIGFLRIEPHEAIMIADEQILYPITCQGNRHSRRCFLLWKTTELWCCSVLVFCWWDCWNGQIRHRCKAFLAVAWLFVCFGLAWFVLHVFLCLLAFILHPKKERKNGTNINKLCKPTHGTTFGCGSKSQPCHTQLKP